MITDQQRRVIRAAACEEVSRWSREPRTPYEMGAVSLLAAFGIRVLEATQPDSWEMCAMEDGDEQ